MVHIILQDIIYNIIFPIFYFLMMGGYYIALSAVCYSELKILDGTDKNNYSEWSTLFLIEMIAGCIFIVSSSIMIIFRFIFHKNWKKVFAFNVILDLIQLIVFIITAILSIVLLIVGQKQNDFGVWDLSFYAEKSGKIMEEYECIFVPSGQDKSCADEFTDYFSGQIISHIVVDFCIALSSGVLVIGGAKEAWHLISSMIKQNQHQSHGFEVTDNIATNVNEAS